MIPSSVSFIGDRACSQCNSLKTVTIPEGVATLEKRAFEGCQNLVSVEILASRTTIGEKAFSFCSSLKYVAFPKNRTLAPNIFQFSKKIPPSFFAPKVERPEFYVNGNLKFVVENHEIRICGLVGTPEEVTIPETIDGLPVSHEIAEDVFEIYSKVDFVQGDAILEISGGKESAELTSTEKASFYAKTYEKGVLAERGKMCLGSFVILWGHKVEATPTWYGMFLEDGSRLGSIEAMRTVWNTAKKPLKNHAPEISDLQVSLSKGIVPAQPLTASCRAVDSDGDALKWEWVLYLETSSYSPDGFLFGRYSIRE